MMIDASSVFVVAQSEHLVLWCPVYMCVCMYVIHVVQILLVITDRDNWVGCEGDGAQRSIIHIHLHILCVCVLICVCVCLRGVFFLDPYELRKGVAMVKCMQT